MNRVVHFEIHAADPKKAIEFYSSLFGWKFEPYGPPDFYWLITTGESKGENTGINGGLVKRTGANPDPKDPTPVIGYVCTVDVDNVDTVAEAAQRAGATVAVEKQAIPGMAWMIYLKDPQGNIFGIYQADPNAK